MGKATHSEIDIRGDSGGRSPAFRPPPPPAAHRPQRQRPSRWCCWLVPLFVIANVAMFVLTMYYNNCPATDGGRCLWTEKLGRFAFQPLRENPLLGPSSTTLDKMGALDVPKVVHGHEGWRLVSCMWLHAGVVHILANMLSLLFIGIRLEQEFGFFKIGLLYVLSGFGGSMLSAIFIKSSISVGASGALFGLLGAMLSELLTNWTIYANKCGALVTLILVIAINLAVGMLPHVDNFAHVGGFVTGFLLGFILLMRPQYGYVSKNYLPPGHYPGAVKRKHKIYQYILWTIATICLIIWFAVGLIMLFRGVNAYDHCSWCHYLSCIPTPGRSCSSSPSSSPSVIYCSTSQQGSHVNITCDGTGKSNSYILPNPTEAGIRELCTQLCT